MRRSSFGGIGDGNTPSSPAMSRATSQLKMGSSSPFTVRRTPLRSSHRTEANIHQPMAMTMWSAGCGYLKVLSCSARGKSVKQVVPDWANPSKKKKEHKEKKEKKEDGEEEKDEKKEGKPEDKETEEKDKKKEGKEGKEGKKKKDKKKKDKKKEKKAAAAAVEEENAAAPPSPSSPVSPSTPGFGTMVLCPKAAPNYIIYENSADWLSLGGIVLNNTRNAPILVMSLKL